MYNVTLTADKTFAGYCGGRVVKSKIISARGAPNNLSTHDYLLLPADSIASHILHEATDHHKFVLHSPFGEDEDMVLYISKKSYIGNDLGEQLDTIIRDNGMQLNASSRSIRPGVGGVSGVGKSRKPVSSTNRKELFSFPANLLLAKSPATHLRYRQGVARNNRLRVVHTDNICQGSLAMMKVLYDNSVPYVRPRWMHKPAPGDLPTRQVWLTPRLRERLGISDRYACLYITLLPTFNNPSHNHEACCMVISSHANVVIKER